jgi:hypothetical protein
LPIISRYNIFFYEHDIYFYCLPYEIKHILNENDIYIHIHTYIHT